MEIEILRIELAKRVFRLRGPDCHGRTVHGGANLRGGSHPEIG